MVNVCMLKSAKKAARSRVFYSLKTSSTTLNVKRWLAFVNMVLEFSEFHTHFYHMDIWAYNNIITNYSQTKSI